MSSKTEQVAFLREFYKGRKVLVTGVHGFKGSWLALLLEELGATVVGVGLQAPDGGLFPLLEFKNKTQVYSMDVRDTLTTRLIVEENPEVIFHLAAQPIVSVGYKDPYLTYSTNVLGTVNVLEGMRGLPGKTSMVNVTTDKVYQNIEKPEAYLEDDRLMGEDPYSSSKSCSELVAYSYRRSFFEETEGQKVLSTCRAGNVIGGGDFALNRIIPDMARALAKDEAVLIRNFDSIRPYEHALDALYAYVLLAARQWHDPALASAYNVGPNNENVMRTEELVNFFVEIAGLKVIDGSEGKTFHEAHLLSLDSAKFRNTFNWEPTWATKDEMLEKTLTWYQKWIHGGYNVTTMTTEQIKEFLND